MLAPLVQSWIPNVITLSFNMFNPRKAWVSRWFSFFFLNQNLVIRLKMAQWPTSRDVLHRHNMNMSVLYKPTSAEDQDPDFQKFSTYFDCNLVCV